MLERHLHQVLLRPVRFHEARFGVAIQVFEDVREFVRQNVR